MPTITMSIEDESDGSVASFIGDEEYERRLENGLLEDEDSVAEEVHDHLLPDGWTFKSFSRAGSQFHGSLHGASTNLETIKLEYNSSDQTLLEIWKNDAREALRKSRKVLGAQCTGTLTPIMAFAAALPEEYLKLFAEWLNDALRQSHGDQAPKVSFNDLISFLKVETLMRVYGFSATMMKKMWPDIKAVEKSDVELHTKVRKYMRKADIPYSEQPSRNGVHNPPFSVDPVLQELQHACSEHWSSLFFSGLTLVNLDDDKLPVGSLLWEHFGIKLIPTKSKKKKPVVHVVGSVGTCFLLSVDIEPVDCRLSDSIGNTIDKLVGKRNKSANTNSLVFFIDRGYLALANEQEPARWTNIVQLMVEKGVRFLGTAKHTTSFPFCEKICKQNQNKPVVSGERVSVPVRGTRAVFSATHRTTNVTALMMRHGMSKQGVARLITNNPSFTKTTWVYETNSGRDANSPGGVKRIPHKDTPEAISEEQLGAMGVEARSTRAFEELESRVFEMTREQGSEDWFLARLFRSSSTNTHVSMDCTTSVFLNTPVLKKLHQAVKKTAQLEPKEAITFDNAAWFAPEEVEVEEEDQVDERSTNDSNIEGHSAAGSQQATQGMKRVDRTKFDYWYNNHHTDELVRIVTVEAKQELPEKFTNKSLARLLADLERQTPGISQSWNVHRTGGFSSSSSSLEQTSFSQSTPIDVDELESSDDEVDDPQVVFLQVMVKRWFLTPFDGGVRAGGALGMGSLNKAVIARNLKTFIATVTKQAFSVVKLKEYGLLVNREVPYAADSPDGVCALSKAGEDGTHYFYGIVALEYKTSTSINTIDKTRKCARDNGLWVTCRAGTDAMRQAIPNPLYRTQVVHHAAVLGVSHTLLVYSTPTRIEQAVLVEISTEQRRDWLRFLKILQDKYMGFAYGEGLQSPPRLGKDRRQVYGYAREHHTLDQYLGLWRAHADDVTVHGTPPTAARILPKMTSSWNKFMGNIDTPRKVINTSTAIYRGLKPSGLVWMTFLDYTFYNAFRLWQTSKLVESGETFDTFASISNARKKLGTCREYLRALVSNMSPFALRTYKPALAPAIDGTLAPAIDGTLAQDWRTHSPESLESPGSEGSFSATQRPPKRRRALRGAFKDPYDGINALRLSKNSFHELVETPGKRQSCVLCCTACDKGKQHKIGASGKPLRSPRVRCGYCSVCNVPVCKKCWVVYHNAETLPVPFCERQKLAQ